MKKIFWFLLVSFLLSCNTEDRNAVIVPKGDFQNGFFIVNQGENGNSGSLDYVSQNEYKVLSKVYDSINHTALGQKPHSVLTYGDHLYISVSGDNKLIKLNRNTLEQELVREDQSSGDLINPKYMAINNGKGFIGVGGNSTDGNSEILTLNLETLATEKTISVSNVPGKIFSFNGKIYVLLEGDAQNPGNKIAIINPNSGELEKELIIGFYPNHYTAYRDKIIISCNGLHTGTNNEAGSLWELNNDEVSKIYERPNASENLQDFSIDRDGTAYFLVNGQLYNSDFNGTITNEKTIGSTIYNSLFRINDRMVALKINSNLPGQADVYISSDLYESFATGIHPVDAGE